MRKSCGPTVINPVQKLWALSVFMNRAFYKLKSCAQTLVGLHTHVGRCTNTIHSSFTNLSSLNQNLYTLYTAPTITTTINIKGL